MSSGKAEKVIELLEGTSNKIISTETLLAPAYQMLGEQRIVGRCAMNAVLAENLSKIYTGGNKAVNSISFRLERGEIFGFLGPNGAGKTTTIKLLCGMLTPTSGSCRVFDIAPVQNPEKLHQMAGVITEHAQMYDHLSGMDNLIFYGTLFGMNRSACEKKAKELFDR